MHHLINELRPHQARESIRVLLQVQKRQRMEITTRLHKQIGKVQEMITTAAKSVNDNDINEILKESLPDNFDKPKQAPPAELSDQEDSNKNSVGNLTEMDAVMCDLLDDF